MRSRRSVGVKGEVAAEKEMAHTTSAASTRLLRKREGLADRTSSLKAPARSSVGRIGPALGRRQPGDFSLASFGPNAAASVNLASLSVRARVRPCSSMAAGRPGIWPPTLDSAPRRRPRARSQEGPATSWRPLSASSFRRDRGREPRRAKCEVSRAWGAHRWDKMGAPTITLN